MHGMKIGPGGKLNTRDLQMSKKNKPVFGTREWADLSANCAKGCENNCLYCVSPDTLITMSDGTTKEIKDIVVGDSIVGVEKIDGFWTFVPSFVKHIWTVKKYLADMIQMVQENY